MASPPATSPTPAHVRTIDRPRNARGAPGWTDADRRASRSADSRIDCAPAGKVDANTNNPTTTTNDAMHDCSESARPKFRPERRATGRKRRRAACVTRATDKTCQSDRRAHRNGPVASAGRAAAFRRRSARQIERPARARYRKS